jgi:uncharacterized caspase-like protein
MSRYLLSRVAALSALVLASLTSGEAWAERRVALVIGNSQYKSAGLVLFKSRNDADDVAAALRALDFEVIQKNDAGKRDIDLVMAQFARSAVNADSALFFYAGHGLQYQGRNYLVPVDADLGQQASLKPMEDVRAALNGVNGIKIMILDACHNNPVIDALRKEKPGAGSSLESVRGFDRIDKPQGLLVACSSAVDDDETDAPGRNSIYVGALIQRLREPGLELKTMFRRIADDVNAQTKGRQRPETYVSLMNDYYLNQPDKLAWNQIKDSSDPAALRNFIDRFPQSTEIADARTRLQALESATLERLAQKELAEREAARLRQEQEQRAKPALTDRERREREAAQKRQDAQRARLAAVERERAERETAKRLQEEQQRQKAAQVEQQKREHETTTLAAVTPAPVSQEQACKRDEEKLARLRASLTPDEVVRFERELGCERLRPQVVRLRESVAGPGDSERARQLQEEQQRKKAEEERQKRERETAAAVVTAPNAPSAQIAPTAPVSQDEACKRDEERLARLRASQVRAEVIRFERELTCQKLRPQVVRLRESLGAN